MTDAHEDSDDEDFPEENIDRWEYTFEDFRRHLTDLHGRRMEDTGDDEGAFTRNILRAKRYFDEFYDEPEATRKHSTFFVAMSHVSLHSEDYDTELFGIRHDGGLLVSEALMRGLHWYFAVLPRSEWGSDEVALNRIKDWSRTWLDQHKKTKNG